MCTVANRVLVVGAGPVGLCLALALVHQGIPVAIVDKRDQPSKYSKAMTLQPRTLELLQTLGVAERMIADGLSVNRMNYWRRSCRLAQLALDWLPSPFPFLLQLPQSQVERVLIQSLRENGVEVERDCTLTELHPKAHWVQVSCCKGGSKMVKFTARYVIGCDGAHSTVRELLNIPFHGAYYDEHYIMADIAIADFPLAANQRHTFIGDGNFLIILPMQDDVFRLVTLRVEALAEHNSSALEAFRCSMNQLGVPAMTLGKVKWLTQFYPHRQLAERFRQGRVFLAGDAAHVHSPIGAQGMNTGIQDAMNLAWKLSLVMQGRSSSALLDSYAQERRPVAQQVLARTDHAARTLCERSGLKGIFKRNAWYLYRLPWRARRLILTNTQLSLSYSLRVGFVDSSLFTGTVHPGARAPDFVDREMPQRHFLAVKQAEFTLLLFMGIGRHRASPQAMEALMSWVVSRFGEFLTIHLIADRKPAIHRTLLAHDRVWIDPGGRIHRIYGVRRAAMMLIRPDGYVAAGFPPMKKPLLAVINTLLTEPA
jgi:2-polyprenyl-6-methoxyphenol hydroxylase-like FAD-dependent oxidoreductase